MLGKLLWCWHLLRHWHSHLLWHCHLLLWHHPTSLLRHSHVFFVVIVIWWIRVHWILSFWLFGGSVGEWLMTSRERSWYTSWIFVPVKRAREDWSMVLHELLLLHWLRLLHHLLLWMHSLHTWHHWHLHHHTWLHLLWHHWHLHHVLHVHELLWETHLSHLSHHWILLIELLRSEVGHVDSVLSLNLVHFLEGLNFLWYRSLDVLLALDKVFLWWCHHWHLGELLRTIGSHLHVRVVTHLHHLLLLLEWRHLDHFWLLLLRMFLTQLFLVLLHKLECFWVLG